jgi:hypothetical protein
MKKNCRVCRRMDIFGCRKTGMWKRCFANGPGPQVNSETVLRLAPGGKQFRSCAGIDTTFDPARSQDPPMVGNGP